MKINNIRCFGHGDVLPSPKQVRSSMLLVTIIILIVGCKKDSVNPSNPGAKALSFFEQALAGKWSRYHAYDGSTDYFVFKTDRKGCKWTEPDGGGRTDERSFTNWELDEKNPVSSNVFRIIYTYTGSTSPYISDDEFHYANNEIWLGGYNNLINRPSSTSKDCN